MIPQRQAITITRPDDWHLHVRADGTKARGCSPIGSFQHPAQLR